MTAGGLRALEFDRVVAAVRSFALTTTGAARLEALTPATDPAARARGAGRHVGDRQLPGVQPGVPAAGARGPRDAAGAARRRGPRARTAAPAGAGGLPRVGRDQRGGGAPRARRVAAPEAAGRAARRRSRTRSPRCGTPSRRRATSSITPARRWDRFATGCGGSARSCARRSTRTCAARTPSKYLQDQIVTERNGRFVLLVKAEHRASLPGPGARQFGQRRRRCISSRWRPSRSTTRSSSSRSRKPRRCSASCWR